MPKICGAKIRTTGATSEFSFEDIDLKKSDIVIVETESGLESAVVAWIEDKKTSGDSKVTRVATQEDLDKIGSLKKEEEEAFKICFEKIVKYKLDMRLVGVSLSFDEKNLTFYFTAEDRVDFRELLKDLVSNFRKMIRLQQIGSRDEARLLGGYGKCGREVCCKTFLKDLMPISIDDARGQKLSMVSSSKLSGICGKLMCCLLYEAELYKTMAKNLPAIGEKIKGPKGEAEVIDQNILGQKVLAKYKDGTKEEVQY